MDLSESIDRATIAFLAIAVFEGAIWAGFLVWVGTGAFSSRNAINRCASERISALNGGRDVSFAQSAVSEVRHSFSTLFRPLAGLRRADASWARDVQKHARGALTVEDIVSLEAMLTSVSVGVGISREAVGDTHPDRTSPDRESPARISAATSGSRSQLLMIEERARQEINGAQSLGDVRRTLAAARWGLLRVGVSSLAEREHRARWQRLGATCADYIGRGAAFNLVVTMVIARRVAELETILSITSLIGGAVGAIAFAAMLLERSRRTITADSSAFLSRLTRRPLLMALAAPTWTACFIAGVYALKQWLPIVLPR
ncbi:hypothetical protein ACR8AL_12035 [Clavibacter sepedonicus]|uniref:hypothetical protein n=1 Tax=Clavibacter TaxID=1573 RepID=UPI00059CF10B|nr:MULTISPECIES: hypothetical protein [Clavibacter]MBD5382769.1 hypothetical protein [Clavibacter sp.]OQJ49009.1 hypothetical protein B5P19_12740 [Clavibacter sepedonicus]OQJ53682.1 hypothetical protein B5P20_05710 [Clavibacter sepedonicus]UUK65196.1 hypothetical protein LRE50_13060 [Clavibacter sepedonicus]